jgi:CubicO group peptidase (beta-lactamase class C family)
VNDAVSVAASSASASLASAVAAGSLPAAAFAVAVVGRGTVHRWAGGVADPTSGRPASATTPFSLASTTKPIATTVLGSLIDDGALELDAPVRRWVPEMPRSLGDASAEPTLRHVAAHIAGLGVHHRFFYDDERQPVPVAEAVRRLARPAFPVGREWRYSNLGYGVLQLACERAAGVPFAELVRRRVYEPLGMTDSGFGEPLGPAGSAVRCLPTGQPYAGYVTDHPPASEAWASIDDLISFGLAHADRTLLHETTHALLATPVAPRQPDGGAYALGWVQREFGEHTLLVHGGRMGGVGAHLTVVPTLGLVIAALANVETDALAEAVGQVLRASVPGWTPVVGVPAWEPAPAAASMVGKWLGLMIVDDEEFPVVLDVTDADIHLEVAEVRSKVAMSSAQPHLVAGHARLGRPHRLLPDDAVVHVDLVSTDDVLEGAFTFAQYPRGDRVRQGDAVSAPVLLERVRAARP